MWTAWSGLFTEFSRAPDSREDALPLCNHPQGSLVRFVFKEIQPPSNSALTQPLLFRGRGASEGPGPVSVVKG